MQMKLKTKAKQTELEAVLGNSASGKDVETVVTDPLKMPATLVQQFEITHLYKQFIRTPRDLVTVKVKPSKEEVEEKKR